MKKYLFFIIFGITAYFSALPLLTQAQATSVEDMLDVILRQYDQTLREHNNMIDTARGITEEEYLNSLFEQIGQAGQAVHETQSSSITIDTNPRYPQPYQSIAVSLSGFGVRLNEARISWFVDGELVRSGMGTTSINTQLEEAGKPTIITVTVEPLETATFTRTAVIVPNEVDLLWESVDAHTPPFYRGKALPSYDSVVKVTAIPNVFNSSGQKIGSNNLVYTWSLNGRKRDLSQYSGYGNNTAFAFASFLNKGHTVSVEISNSQLGIDTRKTTLFVLQDPEIIFYQKEPLAGINYENALGSSLRTSVDSSIRIVAEPYFFDMRNGFSEISLDWQVDGRTAQSTSGMNWGEIPLTTQGRGVSNINLVVNTSKLLQRANNSIQIISE